MKDAGAYRAEDAVERRSGVGSLRRFRGDSIPVLGVLGVLAVGSSACPWPPRPVVAPPPPGAAVARVDGLPGEAPPEKLGLPRDWRRFDRLIVEVENGATPATVVVGVTAARGRLAETRGLGGRATALVEVPLDELPLVATAAAPFDVTAVSVRAYNGAPIAVRALSLRPTAQPPERPRVDGFGQRVAADWPGKVHDAAELAAAAADEDRALARLRPPADRDVYGGWTKGPRWQEGGFFTLEQDGNGRSWLVDPLGNAFWSIGIAAVRTRADATPVHGREWLFAGLPDPQSPEGRQVFLPAGDGAAIAFYRWNVLRKWGTVAAWRDRTLDRFQRWGLNTVGSFAVDPEVITQRRVPHTRFLTALSGAGVPATPSGFADVFDPRWPAFVDALAAAEAAPNRDNPWLLGYFVDDGPRWGDMRLLEAPLGVHLRARWSKFLRDVHGDVAGLNRAWGTRYASWDAARELVEAQLPQGRAREDLMAFEALYAETYFQTIAAALRKHDPNHLYLGCHFARELPANEGVVRAAGKAVDVLTLDDGARAPDRKLYDRWHDLVGKPILVGEHGADLAGPQRPPSAEPALAPAERRGYYVRFLSGIAMLPYVVGAHWAQWADHPITGRAEDGQARLAGFVDVTDRPHDELVAAAREVTERIYPLHAAPASP